jgi:transcriptional regulator with XRE-family HTH domain
MNTDEDRGGRKEWAASTHRRIAAALVQAREDAGWTTNQLATETARLNCPVSRSQITRYETGAKLGLDVTELMALAAALRIPPITLLYGGHPAESVEVLPGDERPNVEALAWFSGDPGLSDHAVEEPNSRQATILRLTRERAELESTLADLRRRLASSSGVAERYREQNLRGTENMMDDIAEIDTAISDVAERSAKR